MVVVVVVGVRRRPRDVNVNCQLVGCVVLVPWLEADVAQSPAHS